MTPDTDKITLRPYRSTDAAALLDIYSHYVANSPATFDLEPPAHEAFSTRIENIVGQGHPLVIAQDENTIAGYAYTSTYRSRPAYRFTCETTLYVAPDRRGQGIGSLMLAHLIEQARTRGFNQMVAIITSTSTGSIALHRKFGFQILGEFPELGFKFGQWHGITHMQRTLRTDRPASP